MDAKSTISSGEVFEDLRDTIEGIKAKPITSMGKTYYSVSPQRLSQLERRAERLIMNQPSGVDPRELESAYNEVVELRKANESLKKMEQAANAEKSVLLKNLSEAKKGLDAKTALATQERVKLSSDAANLRKQLQDAQAALLKAKSNEANAARTKNIDDLPELVEVKEKAALQVQALNNALQKVNSDKKKSDDEVNRLRKSIENLEFELEEKKGQAVQLHNLFKSGDESPLKPLHFSPALETLIGKEGMLILSKWHTLAFDDAKEKAYMVKSALLKSPNKLLKAIGKLMERAWQWAKAQAFKARVKIEPFINMVISDLQAGKIRTVRIYKEVLESIISEKEKLVEQDNRYTTKLNVFEEVYFYGWAITNRVKRKTNRFLRSCYEIAQSTWSFVTSLFRNRDKGKAKWFPPKSTRIGEVLHNLDEVEPIQLSDRDFPSLKPSTSRVV